MNMDKVETVDVDQTVAGLLACSIASRYRTGIENLNRVASPVQLPRHNSR